MNRALQAVLTVVWGLAAGSVQAQTTEDLHFPSLDGTVLSARLMRPDTAVRGVVVALHGCGGLWARGGQSLTARHRAMADMLNAEGYAVLFPDSLRPRGVQEICTQRARSRRIGQDERRADALATLAWLGQQPWAPAGKVAVLGWSHGGSAVLATTDGQHAQVAAQQSRFALGIAFYPGCGDAQRSRAVPNTPLALMLGEKDDWTAPGPCVDWGRAVGAEVNVYPDSFHGFDDPQGTVRLRSDVPGGVSPGHGVHVGANPQARAAAYGRVKALLAGVFP